MRIPMPFIAVFFAAAHSLAGGPADNSAIIGVWKGTMQGLPAVTVTVEEEEGKLRGALLFYLIRRDAHGARSASPGIPTPMIEPIFDGKVLSFRVSHRYAHPPRTLNDPPVKFHLEITGPDRAKLVDHEVPALEMARDKYN